MKELDNLRQKILAEAGLTHSEREVYLAGLYAEGQTSAELIIKTRLPRQTVLAALKELRGKAVCEVHRRDGRSFLYVMQPPSALKAYLGKKVRHLDSVMDKLDDIGIQQHAGVSTREASGQAELQGLLELALRCKSRRWHIIAPRNNAIAFMPADYIKYFKQVRSQRQIQSQTLWESTSKGADLGIKDVLMRKPRYIPDNLGQKIPSLMLAFDDMLLVVDGTNHPSAALIQNKSVVATFQLLFEIAWRSSRK